MRTKYNLNDIVYTFYRNRIFKTKICEIRVNDFGIEYTLFAKPTNFVRYADRVYDSLEEAIEKIEAINLTD